jgi:hypothetical protein
MGGYAHPSPAKESASLASLCGEVLGMLQWKPKLIALVAILALVAAVSGQFTWDSFEMLSWF